MNEGIEKLLKDVNIPTEAKPEQEITAAGNTEKVDAGLHTAGEIRPEIRPEIKPEIKEAVTEPVKEKLPVDVELCKSGADIVIGMFDLIQTSAFTLTGRAKKNSRLTRLHGEDAPDKLAKLIQKITFDNQNNTPKDEREKLTSEQWGMLSIEQAVTEYIEDLGLTEDEKRVLQAPLVEIMKKRGGTIPPEILLLIGFLQITGARVGELLTL